MRTIFNSKYSKRFLKVLEGSLLSSSVPIMIVISFVKVNPSITQKLARLSLKTEVNTTILILCIIFNIIKTHPKSVSLLSGKLKKGFLKTKNTNELEDEDFLPEEEIENTGVSTISPYDQFDNLERDPFKTKANRSGLWELYTLKTHYCSKVRKIVKRFESDFLKAANFDLETLTDIKESDFLYSFNEKTVSA